MKNCSPRRKLVMTAAQAKGLKRLLLSILDGHVEQTMMTEVMVLKLFNQMQKIYGYSPYNKRERIKAGFRVTRVSNHCAS